MTAHRAGKGRGVAPGTRRRTFSLLLVVLLVGTVGGQVIRGRSAARARLPQFDAATSSNIFFDDVFTRLVGERPGNLNSVPAPAVGSAAAAVSSSSSSPPGQGWSQWISAATIEDEVKAIKQNLDKNVTTPSDFAGRGHKPVRRDLSVLAMLFGVIGEYDQEVRWKSGAPKVRDVFARTAANTKAGGNAQVYAEAKVRKGELEELLAGNTPAAGDAEAKATWGQLADRAPLMQRLEAAFDGKLNPLVASKAEFSKNHDSARHEAEMIAAISEVLRQEGMADADDDTYAELASGMRKAARDIVDAIKLDNYDQAREAAGVISKMCSECHESYRG